MVRRLPAPAAAAPQAPAPANLGRSRRAPRRARSVLSTCRWGTVGGAATPSALSPVVSRGRLWGCSPRVEASASGVALACGSTPNGRRPRGGPARTP